MTAGADGADAWGVQASYEDALGAVQTVAPEVVERLRATIGEPDPDQRWPIVVRAGAPAPTVGPGTVRLEDGGEVAVEGRLPELPLGYHELVGDDGTAVALIVAPPHAHLPDDGRPRWGWSAQLYATRSGESWGMGDLGDLRRLASWSSGLGAEFVLVNPLCAVAPAPPQQPSPYSPASRRFRNPTYLRVADVPGAAGAAELVRSAAEVGRALNARSAIDRDAVWSLKQEALEAIWNATTDLSAFDAWYAAQPSTLEDFATWSALVEVHGARWRTWPEELRRPDGPGVARAVAGLRDRVRFHAWLQWNLELQLEACAAQTSIIQDLPIGVDPDGFDAWTWQDVLVPDTTVGAPPDEFAADGQDWGLPPFHPWHLRAAGYRPFIDTIRASMAHDGGLRIDHVMGLFRLWWVPAGGTAADGAYVRYPAEDLLAIVALESQRHRAVVVGEDLGTVEEAAREALAEHRVLSYKLLWFEDEHPETWPAGSMAAITTHDLPTVVGLWTGTDLEEQERLGLEPNRPATEQMRSDLAAAAHLDDGAPADRVVVAAHELLAAAPSLLRVATLDDACREPRRPNVPGASTDRGNWELALPQLLEDIEELPTARAIAEALAAPPAHAGSPPEPTTAGDRAT